MLGEKTATRKTRGVRLRPGAPSGLTRPTNAAPAFGRPPERRRFAPDLGRRELSPT
jgi:hypothetical protein